MHMLRLFLLCAALVLSLIVNKPERAEAGVRIHFGYGGSHFYVGPRFRHYYYVPRYYHVRPYYHRHRYYRRKKVRRYRYRPYRYRGYRHRGYRLRHYRYRRW